jgi:hypothetical protein
MAAAPPVRMTAAVATPTMPTAAARGEGIYILFEGIVEVLPCVLGAIEDAQDAAQKRPVALALLPGKHIAAAHPTAHALRDRVDRVTGRTARRRQPAGQGCQVGRILPLTPGAWHVPVGRSALAAGAGLRPARSRCAGYWESGRCACRRRCGALKGRSPSIKRRGIEIFACKGAVGHPLQAVGSIIGVATSAVIQQVAA